MIVRTGLVALFCLITASVCAGVPLPAPHEVGQSYLYLRINEASIEARLEIDVADVNRVLGTALPTDREPTQAELAAMIDQARDYIRDHLRIGSGGSWHEFNFTDFGVRELDVADFLLVSFELEGVDEVPDLLDIEYNLLFDGDPFHRALALIERNWRAGVFDNESIPSLIFSSGNRSQTLDLTDSSAWRGFMAMVGQGIWHIWIGIDHILFLLALLFPSVVRRREGRWVPAENFRTALVYVLKVITFFTVAHSITLSLAALGLVNVSSRVVESVIALSIALAAAHNIKPLFKGPDWIIAFVFGLFHGFGFATVLGEIGLQGEFLVLSLLGFNIGVEIGQAAVICLVFPVLFLIRRRPFYPKFILYGSLILILISFYWFIERAFEIDLPAGRVLRWLQDNTVGRFFTSTNP